MDVLVITILIIGIIILIFSIIAIIYYSPTSSVKTSNVGGICSQSSDCSPGLTCNGNICVIPRGGSCINYEQYCVIGSKCVNGECTSLQKDSCVKQPIPDIQTIYTNVYISRTPGETPTKLPISTEYLDLFFYSGTIFLVDKCQNAISAYNSEGTYLKTFDLNIPISSSLEIYNRKVYTIFDNKLYVSDIPRDYSDNFNFIQEGNSIVKNIKADYTMSRRILNTNNVIPGPGIEELYIDGNKILQTTSSGRKQTLEYDGTKYPIIYNGQVYLMDYKTKHYVKQDGSYYIFLGMK